MNDHFSPASLAPLSPFASDSAGKKTTHSEACVMYNSTGSRDRRWTLNRDGFSRRHFFYGTLLAGAVPAAGFGSKPSLKALGYKSPNEKLNIASIGAGGKATSDIRGCAPTENIVALCDVDSERAKPIFTEFDKAAK